MSRLPIIIVVVSVIAILAGLALLVVPRLLTPATTKAPAPAVNSTSTQKTGAKKVPDVGKAGAGEKVIILSKLGMT